MEDRLNLREFQLRLAERLKSTGEGKPMADRLGFVAGERHWLVLLDQVGEVVTVSRLARAPWTQPWFIGVAAVRGAIYGCTDLAAFLGAGQAVQRSEIRLLLANPRFNSNAAFRIDQVLGLRNVAEMQQISPPTKAKPWEGASYEDASGVVWQELVFENLLGSPEFLQVAA
jgi:twitching motility protein PilI